MRTFLPNGLSFGKNASARYDPSTHTGRLELTSEALIHRPLATVSPRMTRDSGVFPSSQTPLARRRSWVTDA